LKGSFSSSSEIRDAVWRAIDLGADDAANESFWWSEILKAILPGDPEKALRIVVRAAFFSERYDQRQLAESILQNAASSHPKEVMHEVGKLILDPSESWRFESGKHVSLIHSLPEHVLRGWLEGNGVIAARKVARHLPAPFISGGEPLVPEITRFVLEKWGNDEPVFHNFFAGVHNLQMYVGSLAEGKRRDAEVAAKFLNHPLPSIRKWAQLELASATAQAEQFQQSEEERGFS